ncbi:MAG TPA: ABC transporter substrate-binding protein [Rectinemataceae bacterium]|nr:ABC transporter substrate-binding protein [Rectinemataceae bacterium]
MRRCMAGKRILGILVILVCVTMPIVAAPTQVVFWSALGGNNGKILDAFVKEFNASQNEVEVVNEFQGAYTDVEQKLMASIASGKTPDLAMLEISRIPAFVNAKAIAALDGFAAGPNGIDLKDFVQGLLEESRIDGKLYSLPQSRSMPVFYYNKDMFRAAGINADKAPANWKEIREAAIKVTAADGSRIGFGIQTGNPWWYFQTAIESYGAQVSTLENGKPVPTFNSPEAVAALQWWYDLVKKDKAAKLYVGKGLTSWELLQADFISGKVGMMYITTGWMGNILKNSGFEVGVGPLAAGPTGARRIPTGGNGIVIPANSPKAKQDAAWKFLKWLTDTKQTANWAMQTGYMPLRISAGNSPEMKAYIAKNPAFQVAVDSMLYASAFPSIKRNPKTEPTCDVLWERIFINNESVQKVADDVAKQVADQLK